MRKKKTLEIKWSESISSVSKRAVEYDRRSSSMLEKSSINNK
jgi:hypothetical protein